MFKTKTVEVNGVYAYSVTQLYQLRRLVLEETVEFHLSAPSAAWVTVSINTTRINSLWVDIRLDYVQKLQFSRPT
jgi:hypothetical protein